MKIKIVSALVVISYSIILLGELLKKLNWVTDSTFNDVASIARIVVLLSAVIIFFSYQKQEKDNKQQGITAKI
jgi:ATP/ADP translocase